VHEEAEPLKELHQQRHVLHRVCPLKKELASVVGVEGILRGKPTERKPTERKPLRGSHLGGATGSELLRGRYRQACGGLSGGSIPCSSK
jgi:hypothetical protein